MNTIRRKSPTPQPSRIQGTLGVRKPADDEPSAEEAPSGREPAAGSRTPRDEPPARPAAGERPSRRPERAAKPERSERAPRRDEGAKPARREDTAKPARGERAARTPGGSPRDSERAPRGESAARRSAEGRSPRGDDSAASRGGEQGHSDAARGSFEARTASAAAIAEAAQARAAVEGVRLSKLMAERGICSRREADEFIERGWVFVDGRRVSELGVRVAEDVRINLAPEATRTQQQRATILLHKPVGYVSGQPEPGYAPAVGLIGPDNQADRDTAQRFHPSHLKNLAPAGRLDIDSTGLLVLTQDGRVARQLIGEDSKVEKEYIVRVEGTLAENGLALLNHGLWMDDRPLRPAEVEWINDEQLRFVLREGRKRQIRRMCELVGLKVVGLKRVRIGRVKLGDLPLGQWRFLREDERFG
ncbi:MAG: pseudouridine synthase [Thauera sp.]|nr:pseudouridine synthase [Thauera sp.]